MIDPENHAAPYGTRSSPSNARFSPPPRAILLSRIT